MIPRYYFVVSGSALSPVSHLNAFDGALKEAGIHNLNFVELPAEINLSDEKFKDFYATAKVEISGEEPGQKITQTGAPIVYGVTIPSNFTNQELAIAWVDFLLSDKGMAIMEANGQPPIIPAGTNDKSKLPDELRKYVTGVD